MYGIDMASGGKIYTYQVYRVQFYRERNNFYCYIKHYIYFNFNGSSSGAKSLAYTIGCLLFNYT
jgi:hypothetical protein